MKYLSKTLVLIGLLALGGCLGMQNAEVKPSAFSGNKTFALVSVSAIPVIESPFGPAWDISMADAMTASGKDNGFSHKSDKIFIESQPKLPATLKSNGRFKLLSGRKILGNSTYKKQSSDNPNGLLLAKGYKFINSSEKAAKLAKALNVDGVITVKFHFTMVNGSGFGIGPVVVSSRHGATGIEVTAYTRSGEVIWKDNVYSRSEGSYSEAGTKSINIKRLYPLLQDSTKLALSDMMKRFKEKLG